MFYVVIIHALSQGGVLSNLNEGSRTSYLAWFLFACGSCAVDIFGLITGYVTYSDEERPFHISGYIRLWLQVVFYGVVVNAVYILAFGAALSEVDFCMALTPVFHDEYWYFSAYTGLFILMPIIHISLRNISIKTGKLLLIVMIAVFSVFGTASWDSFKTLGGQSVFWLIILYMIGALLKKCAIGKKVNIYIIIPAIGVMAILTVILKSLNETYIGCDVSPTLLGQAILYVIAFSRMRTHSRLGIKLIEFAAPSAFSVYLLNCHPVIFSKFNAGRFVFLAREKAYIMAGAILVYAVAFVIVSISLDRLRIVLFQALHINDLTKRCDDMFQAGIKHSGRTGNE